MSLLKSRLYEAEMQKKYVEVVIFAATNSPSVSIRAQSRADAHNTLPEIGWGSQIRSYVLHPYQLIKDARTGHEVGTSGCSAVLDGDLQG